MNSFTKEPSVLLYKAFSSDKAHLLSNYLTRVRGIVKDHVKIHQELLNALSFCEAMNTWGKDLSVTRNLLILGHDDSGILPMFTRLLVPLYNRIFLYVNPREYLDLIYVMRNFIYSTNSTNFHILPQNPFTRASAKFIKEVEENSILHMYNLRNTVFPHDLGISTELFIGLNSPLRVPKKDTEYSYSNYDIIDNRISLAEDKNYLPF